MTSPTEPGKAIRLSCTCSLIDTHTHFVPEHFPKYLGTHGDGAWPSTVEAHACHRHVMIGGKNFRTVSSQCWSAPRRIEDMDVLGLGAQVLSPMPELLSYWLPTEDGARMCRFLNESLAELVATHPQRFAGLGAVPLQSIDAAIKELEYLKNSLGLAGVEIGTNINEQVIGHPSFLPFFEAAQSLNMAVFVHALRPSGMNRLVGPASMEQVLAFPGEVGLAAASMITSATLSKLAHLRIAFSHGGGSLAMLLPRLQHAWQVMPALAQIMPSPRDQSRRMFYDNLVYDAKAITHLIEVFGDSQVMVGSDYPFSIMDKDPMKRVGELDLGAKQVNRLKRENALTWLYGRSD